MRLEATREERGEGIFQWRRNEAIVGPWVGVLQIPGLQLEILPKLDDDVMPPQPDEVDAKVRNIRSNVVEMLRVGGLVASRSRGEAMLRHRRGTVHDQMISGFLDQLLFELQRGLDRAYVSEEDNLSVVRGRIAVARNAVKNPGQMHRVVCRFDLLHEDTALNGTLRAACDLLARRNLLAEQYPAVHTAKVILAEIAPRGLVHQEPVHFTRQNERYRVLYEFARALLAGETPDIRGGETPSFTLLFDMDKVFERYIAAILKVGSHNRAGRVHAQASGTRDFLFHRDGDNPKGVLRLTPDLLCKLPGEEAKNVVIDTKWKRLDLVKHQTPSNADLYQLYAYLHRYRCERAYLLYPKIRGVGPQDFVTDDGVHKRRVGVRFVDLNRPLQRREEREKLADELWGIVNEGVDPAVPGGQ